MGLNKSLLTQIIGSMFGGSAGPLLDIDLTTSLPASLTFTRAGSRKYISAGAFATAGNNVPCFESWDGVARGLAVDASASGGEITQIFTQSNTISDASWTKTAITNSAGGTGPDGVSNSLTALAETTANSLHEIKKKPGSQSAGTRQTFYTVVKRLGTATQWAVRLRMSDEWNNNGPQAYFRIDGTPGHYVTPDTTIATGATAGVRKLANGLYLLWLTGTWVNTGNKEFVVDNVDHTFAAASYVTYSGVVTEGVECFGAQLVAGNVPTGWVTTTTASATQAAESLVFNDLSWFSAGNGTFIIEHDCTSGPLIGSGANTILSATVTGKTAIAWDGNGSDVVSNGGGASAGSVPTFGADIRLLGSSAAGNIGHIKSVKYYATRLSVADMQAATSPLVVSTATPGVLRAASVDNRLPTMTYTTAGVQLNFASRYRLKLGGSDMSSLKLDFANFAFDVATGNAITIDEVYLERVTGVAESVKVQFSGADSVVLADLAANVLSDAILPTSFTSLSVFPANTEFWVRLRGHVASAGQKISVGRAVTEANAQSFAYDPAAVTLTNFNGTGTLTKTGVAFTNMPTDGCCPILVGVCASGDPKTLFFAGDSIVEGTGGTLPGTGTFMRKAARNLGIPAIEFSKGGTAQNTISELAHWKPYLAYCRIYADEFGTNDPNRLLHYFSTWSAARNTYGADKVLHAGLFPRTTSSNSWVDEANQTTARNYPTTIDWMLDSAVVGGYLSSHVDPQSVRGTNKAKWLTNGSANYATIDGLHQSVAADDLLTTEFQAILDALVLT